MKTTNELRKLASLVVFRELYTTNNDIYTIIADFLTDLIKKESIRSFDLTELSSRFNSAYEFSIPDAVIATALKRLDFVKRSISGYHCSINNIISNLDIEKKSSEKAKNNNEIIENLFKYIESQKKCGLNNDIKEKITHSFCTFMLDGANGDEHSEYISAFIISNSNDDAFKTQIETIREAVILYSGIKFSLTPREQSWKKELIVYLETEILFHIAGFNGEVSKQSAYDFLNLVSEVNAKSGTQHIIKLKYFRESKQEIESFFKKAEWIVEKGELLNPDITAMANIVNGCKEKHEIAAKMSDLFTLLKSIGIYEETQSNFFSAETKKYNISSASLIEELRNELCIDYFEENLKLLNYINILRAENTHESFENVGHILLSGNNKTLKLSWNEKIKGLHTVPLATHLTFFTSTLWFKLNKGFGDDSYPKSFNIITKSQIVLSKKTSDNINKKFEEAKDELKKGTITQDQLTDRVINLRSNIKKPEEISFKNSDETLDFLTNDHLANFSQEQSLFKERAYKTEAELQKTKTDNQALQIQLEILQKEKQISQKSEKLNTIKESIKNELNEINRKNSRRKFCMVAIQILTTLLIFSAGFLLLTTTIMHMEFLTEKLKYIIENKYIFGSVFAIIMIIITTGIQLNMTEKLEIIYFTKKLNKGMADASIYITKSDNKNNHKAIEEMETNLNLTKIDLENDSNNLEKLRAQMHPQNVDVGHIQNEELLVPKHQLGNAYKIHTPKLEVGSEER